MKTLKQFFAKHSSHPDLHERVWRAGGVSFAEFKERPSDFYAANTGAVTGMIYYDDTVRFAKKNLVLIMDALNDFENECGLLPNKPTEEPTQFYNWLTWFAWESMAGELMNYLEH